MGLIRVLPLLLLGLAVLAGPARADRLVTDISERQIAITSSFQGTTLLIFGAVQQDSAFDGGLKENDVVIVVRGPSHGMVVRKKEKVAGVWVNKDAVTFDDVPGYYAVASSRPLSEITSAELMDRDSIGIDHLKLPVINDGGMAPDTVADFRAAIIRQQRQAHLYSSNPHGVTLLAQTLFRANFAFPANVPVGDYRVEAYLMKDGRIISAQSSPLSIDKTGLERGLYIMAHQSPLSYGVTAVLLAVIAGWIAGIAFRKR